MEDKHKPKDGVYNVGDEHNEPVGGPRVGGISHAENIHVGIIGGASRFVIKHDGQVASIVVHGWLSNQKSSALAHLITIALHLRRERSLAARSARLGSLHGKRNEVGFLTAYLGFALSDGDRVADVVCLGFNAKRSLLVW